MAIVSNSVVLVVTVRKSITLQTYVPAMNEYEHLNISCVRDCLVSQKGVIWYVSKFINIVA